MKRRLQALSSGSFLGARRWRRSSPRVPDFSKWGMIEKLPLKGVRKATAEGMARNWGLVPHVTQFDVADITGTETARKKFQDQPQGPAGQDHHDHPGDQGRDQGPEGNFRSSPPPST